MRPTSGAMSSVSLHILSVLTSAAFLFPAAPSILRAQQADSSASDTTRLGIIDTIIVTGNEKTRAYVITDEMTLKPGMVATREAMEYDRNRIYSLGLFTRVDLEYYAADSLRFIAVDVSERWYIVPIILLGFKEGDPKKLYYGAGLMDYNFRGRNQRLAGSGALGYNPSADFSFSDPLLVRSHNLYFGTVVSTSEVRNKSALEAAIGGDFNERHYDAEVTLGKRLDLYRTAGLTAGYQIVQITGYRIGRTASPTSRDACFLLSAGYVNDSRDLKEYASRGAYTSLFVTKYGFGESEVNYARFGFDVRRYAPLPLRLSLAGRLYANLSTGELIPTYARVYFGYDERIRGHYTTVYEGEDMAGGTLELRFSLLQPRVLDMTSLPIPREFAFWRFGASLALFADAGTALFHKDENSLKLSSLASGYGGGVDLLLPYSFVVRLGYAINPDGRGQFILDLRGAI